MVEKLDAALPTRIDGFKSPADAAMNASLKAVQQATDLALSRAERQHTIAVWADRVVTAIELVTVGVTVGKAAVKIFTEVAKQSGKKAAAKAVAKFVAVELATAAASVGVGAIVIPEVLAAAGLDPVEVQIGMAAYGAISLLPVAAMAPVARRIATSRGKPKAPSDISLPIIDNEPFFPKFKRLPQDAKVNPKPPPALPIVRPIGLNEEQYQALQADIRSAQSMKARDFRVNQDQVNAEGVRVGTNRPDLQFTLPNGQRMYVEYDQPGSPRAFEHLYRIQANDPSGKVILKTVPLEKINEE